MWQLTEISFLWLLALPALAALYFLLAPRARAGAFLRRLPAPPPEIKKRVKRTRRIFQGFFFLFLVALSLLAVAAARPGRVKRWVDKWTEGIDIAIVLDVSESMDAEDLDPSRIVAAKSVIRQFIEQRPNDRIGLVIFGGEAVMKAPLTRDADFLLSQLESVKLRELKQGTAIGMGITNGVARLRKSESKNKVLILLTDGDSNVGSINPVTAAHLARDEGIRIYTIGIGQNDRVVVPIYAFDAHGRKTQLLAQIPSYLNPKLLKDIAALTGGQSYMARDSGMLLQILKEIDQLEKTKIKLIPRSRMEELFYVPALVAALILLALFVLEETRFSRMRSV